MKGENLNLPKLEEDVLKKIKNINFESEKLFLPVDGVVAKNPDKRAKTIKIKNLKKDYNIYDIGPETIKKFSEVIKEAKTIVWAGPLGFFEKKNFKKGTSQVGKEIVMNEKALKVVGGGDTGFALKTFGIRDSVDHLSLGGGAMLAFLSGEKMPGVEALKK
jgi:3-phosphoglycerate kinase